MFLVHSNLAFFPSFYVIQLKEHSAECARKEPVTGTQVSPSGLSSFLPRPLSCTPEPSRGGGRPLQLQFSLSLLLPGCQQVLSHTCGLEGSPVSSVQQKCRSPSLALRQVTEDVSLEVPLQARSSRSTLRIGSRQ